MHRFMFILAVLVALSLCVAACGSGAKANIRGGVTIEPLTSPTASTAAPAVAPIGGKPAAPPTASDDGVASPSPTADVATAGETSIETATRVPEATATATPEPLASDGSVAPTSGRWIDVDVTRFVVRLMDGSTTLREIAPVAVGEQVDTGAYASTQTGLFHVYNKLPDLAYDPPYDTYISDWVGFDPDKANGFHSFLKDKKGAVVNAGTGRISNGCIRTGASDVLFGFAEVGMPVWVHR